jgi:hypothetical protein
MPHNPSLRKRLRGNVSEENPFAGTKINVVADTPVGEIRQTDHRWHVVMRVTRRDCVECWPDAD